MLSYWEKQSFTNYNHIVIGAGIVGLSLAIELKMLYPNTTVLVLERGLMTTGASSRNAGFACMGSATEVLDDLKTMNEDEVCALFAMRKNGLELLRQRLGDENIGYAANGSYELIGEDETQVLSKIEYLNKLLYPIAGRETYILAHKKIEQFGFNAETVKALIQNTCEGELDTGKMLNALTRYALHCGVEIKTGANVSSFTEEENKVIVTVNDQYRNEAWQLHCDTLSLCTNAFTKQLLPNEDVVPGRGQVLVTKPIEGLRFKGIFHLDRGYYYFREIAGRVLLGGGRNLDVEEETTTELALNERIQNDLVLKLNEIILPNQSYEIDMRWSGIMAFGQTKQPIVRAFSNRVFGAFRMGGMGVAMGSEVASKLANIIKATC